VADSEIDPIYPQIGHNLMAQPFVVVSKTIVDVIYCTAITGVQPMYTQQLSKYAHSFTFTHSSGLY